MIANGQTNRFDIVLADIYLVASVIWIQHNVVAGGDGRRRGGAGGGEPGV